MDWLKRLGQRIDVLIRGIARRLRPEEGELVPVPVHDRAQRPVGRSESLRH